MQLCSTLNRVVKNHVDFDPNNPEHLRAFKMLCLGDSPTAPIRQHESLRFTLESPYVDIRTMMIHKVSEAHIRLING